MTLTGMLPRVLASAGLLLGSLRNYPAYAATGDPAAHRAMIDAGFARGSEFTWDYHYGV